MSTSRESEEQPFRIYSAGSLGTAIRHYRSEAGITQAELAERCGISRTYLSRLEQGSETEQLKRILGVLKSLGVRASLRHEDW
jgi:HTH-type transcriptional regulator / antitoxin HipB